MQRVVESLISAFPAVPEGRVRACVDDLRAPFANARVRTYLPVLVARQARALLAQSSAVGSAVPIGDPGSGGRELAVVEAVAAPTS